MAEHETSQNLGEAPGVAQPTYLRLIGEIRRVGEYPREQSENARVLRIRGSRILEEGCSDY